MTILAVGERAYLYDPTDDTANVLCAGSGGTLRLSFTDEMRFQVVPAAAECFVREPA